MESHIKFCNKINNKYTNILNFNEFGGILLLNVMVNGLYCIIIVSECTMTSNE